MELHKLYSRINLILRSRLKGNLISLNNKPLTKPTPLLSLHKKGSLPLPPHSEMSINRTVLHLNISDYYAAPALTYSKWGSQSN